MLKRCQTIKKGGSKILDSYGCEKTGGGVVVGETCWNRSGNIYAYYFRPRAHRSYFRSEPIISKHERLGVRDRLTKLLQAEKEAKVAPHDLKVGEILSCTWGYTMQGARFYKVLDIPHPRKVTISQIGQRMKSGDWMSGYVIPNEDETPSKENAFTVMVDMSRGHPICKTGSSIERMTRWSGDPIHIYSD